MRAGRLRHRVEIQRKEYTQDPETGAGLYTWQTVYLDSNTPLDSVPAEVLTGPGRELRAEGTKYAETSARITLRWFEGLQSDWRILWDGKVYDIISIETDATARREYRLNVKDGVNDGA